MSYLKYYAYKLQYSRNNGMTWRDVIPLELVPSGDSIGKYSTLEECSGPEPPPECCKYIIHYVGGSVNSAYCDSTSSVTSGDITSYNYIESVEIGNCVTKIGKETFAGCRNLTSFTMSNNIAIIEEEAFENCSNLSSITLPNTIKYIGNRAFNRCSSLTNIVLPDSLECNDWSQQQQFSNCTNLTGVTIGNGIKNISSCMFSGCTSLQNIVIPNNITGIGLYAFYGCSSLSNITIPDSVGNISDWAFSDCIRLSSCTIGSGITVIVGNAFNNCVSLTSITINAVYPPAVGYNAFYNTNNCPIYVPEQSVKLYKTTGNWTNYASRIQAIP